MTFLRLAAKLSEMITNFQGCNLKIQNRTSFDLNGLKSGLTKFFEKSIKSMQSFQILMGGMNFRERSQKNQTSLAVRSALVWGLDFAALFLNLTGGYNVKQRSVPWWCACRRRGCHLGISVNPISTRRGRLCPPHY